jgi:hypothetical protein
MAGEEVTLIAKVQPYASVLGTAFSISSGIYGMVKTDEQWAQVNKKLDEILDKLKAIQTRLEDIYGEVQWGQMVTQLNTPLETIQSFYDRIIHFKNLWIKDKDEFREQWEYHKSQIDKWAADVLSEGKDGIPFQLKAIDNVIRGTLLSVPLMKSYVQTPRNKSSSQSPHYDAVSYFESWLLIQQKAIICLGNAFMYADPKKLASARFREKDFFDDGAGLLSKLKSKSDALSTYLYNQLASGTRNLIDQYSSQEQPSQELRAALVADFDRLLNGPSLYDQSRFAQAHLSESTEELSGTNPQGSDLKRLNRRLLAEAYPNEIANRPNLADTLEFLEEYTNVEGTEIPKFQAQAKYSHQFVFPISQYYENTYWGRDEGTDYFSFGPSITSIDTNEVFADRGYAIVGVQLYQKGDCIALKILQARFDGTEVEQDNPQWKENRETSGNKYQVWAPFGSAKNKVSMRETYVGDGQWATGVRFQNDPSSDRTGIELLSQTGWPGYGGWNPADLLGDADPGDFVVLKGTAQHVSGNPVRPTPLSTISGARLRLHGGPDEGHQSYRISIVLSTGHTELEDVWQKYALEKLATQTILTGEQQRAIGTPTQ